MRRILFWLMIANAVSMVANLLVHAYGSHSTASLSTGILNGFVMLFLQNLVAQARDDE